MKEYTITGKDDGRRLDKWLLAELPLLSPGLCQKYIRLKRVKVNGKGAARDTRLAKGDVLSLYINDELFEKPHRVDALLSKFHWHLSVVYEDENILLVDKRPGIMVHADATEKLNTLVTHVRVSVSKGRIRLHGRGCIRARALQPHRQIHRRNRDICKERRCAARDGSPHTRP